MIQEIFKTIEFKGKLITVGNFGTIKQKVIDKPRKLHLNSSGYLCYTSDRCYLAHRLVALAFCENANPTTKIFVNHKDGNKLNNHYTNLEWVTKSENELHSIWVLGNKRNIDGFKRNWEDCVNKKPIIMYDLSMNKVAEFASGVDAAKHLKTTSTAVSNNLRGISKTCKNYIFKYKNL